MSEALKSVHIRLTSEAHRVLSALADVQDKDNAEMARLIVEEALLGRVHGLMLTAERYHGLGLRGTKRDFEGPAGKERK